MMGNPSKNKGKCIEREVAEVLSKVTGESWIRVPNSGAFIGGSNVERITTLSETQVQLCRGDIIPPSSYVGYTIEVKGRKDFAFNLLFSKSLELESWIDQAMIDHERSKSKYLLVVFKINRKGMFVCTLDREIPVAEYPRLKYMYKNILFNICEFNESWIKTYIKKTKVDKCNTLNLSILSTSAQIPS